MKLKTIKGDLFKADAQVIAHGCNAMGAMGAGIAIQFRVRFPAMFRAYRAFCKNPANSPIEGKCFLWGHSDPKIACLFTQNDWQASLALIEQALLYLKKQMEGLELTSLALPAIGCGLAKTSDITLEKVQAIIDKVFGESKIETTMYLM